MAETKHNGHHTFSKYCNWLLEYVLICKMKLHGMLHAILSIGVVHTGWLIITTYAIKRLKKSKTTKLRLKTINDLKQNLFLSNTYKVVGYCPIIYFATKL